MPIDRVGNTRSNAASFGTLFRPRRIIHQKEALGGTDKDDFYSFTLKHRSSFLTFVANLRAGADLYLLNKNGRVLEEARSSGTSPNGWYGENINTTLKPGTYYIHIKALTSKPTKYILGLEAKPPINYYFLKFAGRVDFVNRDLKPGDVVPIQWTDNFPDDARIDLYRRGVYLDTITASTPSDGSYDWTIPTGLKDDIGYGYQIVLSRTQDPKFSITSFYFNILPTPSITVNNPTSGNSLTKGDLYMLSWSNTILDPVRVDLFKGGVYLNNVVERASNSFYWSVPTTLADASDYQIKVSSITNPGVSDYSDGFFSIGSASV